jgi:hypothetical protein
VSYFLGNDPAKHRSGLPSYRYLSLGEVWPGVEVKLKASQKTVEKLFYLHPKADPSQVRIELQGANALKLSPEGEILIETGLGELKLSKPVAWQEKEGKKLPVQVSYQLLGKQRYGFKVAQRDPSLPLVIDPILQSTYLGGVGNDLAYALAIHPTTGEVYVAGSTYSPNFPYTFGGAQPSWHPGYLYDDDIGTIPLADSFVARLNSTLTQILQATYLGGSGVDSASALVIHPSTGEIYVAGSTNSTDFPRTGGGAQASNAGGSDAFVARLAADLASPEGGCQVPPGLAGEVVYVPLVEVGGKEYSAGLSLVSGRPLLELISLKPAIQITDFCPAATLTGDRVHIPLAVYGGHSYAGELRMFEENGRLLFEVVSARPLD